MRSKLVLVAAVSLTLAGCATSLPVGMSLQVDPDTGPSCERACKAVGMQVGGIVFIRNMGGCVCQPAPGGTQAPRVEAGASAVHMAGAVVVLEEEAAAQQNQQQAATGVGGTGSGHR
jgi:hypothetical protein